MARKSTLKPNETHQGSAELGLAQPDSAGNISEQANSSEGNPLVANSAKKPSVTFGSDQAGAVPPGSVSRDNAEHYRWGHHCDGWHLLHNAQLSVIQERMPAGTSEVRHFHHHAQQFFYVLDGVLTLEIEEQTFVLQAGEGIEISPRQRHQAFNRSLASVRFLVTSQPPSHGDRINE